MQHAASAFRSRQTAGAPHRLADRGPRSTDGEGAFEPALETADIAFGSDVEPLPALDPPIGDTPVPAEARTELMDLIAAYSDSGNMILVTDLKVIEALTGQGAREGEAVIVRPDGETLHVMARIVFN